MLPVLHIYASPIISALINVESSSQKAVLPSIANSGSGLIVFTAKDCLLSHPLSVPVAVYVFVSFTLIVFSVLPLFHVNLILSEEDFGVAVSVAFSNSKI